jgi:phage repressor protein C with HTH and peptisase S24 domain
MFRRLEELERGPAPSPSGDDNVRIGKLAVREVPVVSWARAGEGINYEDLCRQLEEWTATDSRDPNAFAVILEGDSMEPRFFAGDRVVIAPNAEPRNGDFVLARLRDGGVLFKQYQRTGPEGQMVRLTSINPNYQPKELDREDFLFIYPAIEVLSKLRR